MPPLNTEPNFTEPGTRQRWAHTPGDVFYDALVAAHAGLGDEQSELLNARLILLLANHVGDLSVLREAIALARAGVADKA
jgi:Protein of unknown function (DUF2783)